LMRTPPPWLLNYGVILISVLFAAFITILTPLLLVYPDVVSASSYYVQHC
jgi:hypothetical protein